MERRAYLRGVGAVTPLGRAWPESARALELGKSAVREVSRFDVTGFPCTVAAAIDGEDGGRALGERDRRLAFALAAAREAWREADLDGIAPGRLGVFIGAESGRTTFQTLLRLAAAGGGGPTFNHASFGAEATKIAAEINALVASPAAVASAIAGELGAGGPVQTISLACASGSAAIAEATRAIRLGAVDAAICGGVGADVDVLMFAAFGLLGALSARGASRPFDARRDGFVLGEGAAMAVLSSERGGADVVVAGIGRTLDAFHLTAPDPAGDGAARAMREALRDAGLAAVDYVQAHGTSTPLNDAVEAAALRRVLGARLSEARVSSVKGALGHWIAGAGALGFVCAAEAIRSGMIAPTAGLLHPDEGCELPHVIGEAISRDVRAAMVNSFGFGGANCSIVLRREA